MQQSLGIFCLHFTTSVHLVSTLFTLDNRQYRHYPKPNMDKLKPNMDISSSSDKSNTNILQQMYHPYDEHEYGFVSDPLRFEKKHAVSRENIPGEMKEKRPSLSTEERKEFKRGEIMYHLPLDTSTDEEYLDYERYEKDSWTEHPSVITYQPSDIYPVLHTIERQYSSQPKLYKSYTNTETQIPTSYENGRFIFITPRPMFRPRSSRLERVSESEDQRYLKRPNVPFAYRPTTTQSPLQMEYPIITSLGGNFISMSDYFDNYAQLGTPKYLLYNPWIVENGVRPQFFKTVTVDGGVADNQKKTPEVVSPELLRSADNKVDNIKQSGVEGVSRYVPSLTTNPDTSKEVIGRLISLKDEHYTDGQDETAISNNQNSESLLYPKLSQILEKDNDAPREPCQDRDDGDYAIDSEVLEMFPDTDPQCNFIKCANHNVYIYPCGIGSRNQANGKGHDDYGFCGFRDSEQHCGIYENRIHNRFVTRS